MQANKCGIPVKRLLPPVGKKDDIERSALLSLKLVETTLEKQREFTHCLRQQNASVLVTSLDQLLLGIGVRHSSDSIAQIARYRIGVVSRVKVTSFSLIISNVCWFFVLCLKFVNLFSLSV